MKCLSSNKIFFETNLNCSTQGHFTVEVLCYLLWKIPRSQDYLKEVITVENMRGKV